MIIGTFGVVVLNGLNALPIETKLAALIGGLLGADILGLITKKVGLVKGINVMSVSDEEVQLLEFNDRQINALNYLNRNDKITKKEYQKLNQTSPDCAKRDLANLVRKGKLKKSGMGKSICYKLT